MRKILTLGQLHPTLTKLLANTYDVVVEPDEAVEGVATSIWGPVTRELLAKLPALKVVSSFGVGLDHIDLRAARERQIKVGYTPGVLDDAVAETALALMLSIARRVPEGDRFVRAGKWPHGVFSLGRGLTGKKLGIVGLGRIGRAIANRAKPFGLEIAYQGPHRKDDVEYEYFANVRELALAVDYLVLALPGGPGTKHIVNTEVLSALGPEGFLINVARGSVVDEQALIAALQARSIAGAALDVFEDEPNVPEALVALENVVLLPHIGSGTVETREAMAELTFKNLREGLEGRPLISSAPVT